MTTQEKDVVQGTLEDAEQELRAMRQHHAELRAGLEVQRADRDFLVREVSLAEERCQSAESEVRGLERTCRDIALRDAKGGAA